MCELSVHVKLLRACKTMRDRLTTLANDSDACWHDWSPSYGIDAVIAEAEGLRFGVTEVEGEDDEEGNVWFQIGPIESDNTIDEEVAVVMLRNAEQMERRFPNIRRLKQQHANMIAEALTEYVQRRHIASDQFFSCFGEPDHDSPTGT